MAFLDSLRQQLRSVIEWESPSEDVLFELWSENGDEIKQASKLIVAPGQGCVFVYKGKIRAVYTKPGTIELNTDNIPFWTTISKFMQSFESEYKVEIFFFRTTRILDQKWGTTSVVKYEDPVYCFPVGLKAYGNYSIRIADPRNFFVNVAGNNAIYTVNQFREIMASRIIHPLADYLAERKFSYTQIDAQLNEITTDVLPLLQPEFERLGFELTDFRIEGTSFDDQTLKRINRIADMTAESNAAKAVGLSYKEMAQIDAMKDAAKNEGGAAGIGMGMGAGIGFGQQMAGAMTNGTAFGQGTSSSESDVSIEDRLKKLKSLFDAELINEVEYMEKRKALLDLL